MSTELNSNKMLQLYETLNELEILPNQSDILVDRFYYEFLKIPKEKLYEFYLRVNHAISIESSIKNKNINNLRLFCGIFQYLIWTSIKYEDINQNNEFSNNLKEYITNKTINYLNCFENDLRIMDFINISNWIKNINFQDIQSKAWNNLQCLI